MLGREVSSPAVQLAILQGVLLDEVNVAGELLSASAMAVVELLFFVAHDGFGGVGVIKGLKKVIWCCWSG